MEGTRNPRFSTRGTLSVHFLVGALSSSNGILGGMAMSLLTVARSCWFAGWLVGWLAGWLVGGGDRGKWSSEESH